MSTQSLEIQAPNAYVNPDAILDLINEHDLRLQDFKVLLRILHYTEAWKPLKASQAQIMRDIGANPAHSSRIFNKLKAADILVQKDGETFLNPLIFSKGEPWRDNQEEKEYLEFAELIEFSAADMKKRGQEPNFKMPRSKEGKIGAAKWIADYNPFE